MKKVIIFTSEGGGGHMAVTKALTEYLQDDYQIQSVLIFTQTLSKIDPAQCISFHNSTGENFYNFFIRRKYNRIINLMYRVGRWYYRLTKNLNQKYITQFLEKERPDLVISVIPLVNNDILCATRHLNIPFVLIPTDLDARTFVNGMHNPESKQFICTLAFNDPEIKKIITSTGISDHQLRLTGFPLRSNFFSPKNHSLIKKEFDIQPNKPVIMLLMGAVGLKDIYNFTAELARITYAAHLIICLGKNEALHKAIKEINYPIHLSVTIIGFTERIADLMAISDLLITKSGSVSFCEGIYSQLPMLLDATSPILEWEKFNHTFALDHGFGQSIKKLKELSAIINRLLADPHALATMKRNIEKIMRKNGGLEIKKLVDELLESSE